MPHQVKQCCICHQEKRTYAFNKKKSAADGLQAQCKVCTSEYQKRHNRTLRRRRAAIRAAHHREKLLMGTDTQELPILATQDQLVSKHQIQPDSLKGWIKSGELEQVGDYLDGVTRKVVALYRTRDALSLAEKWPAVA